MSSYDRCTMFHFLLAFYFLFMALPEVLSQSQTDTDEPPKSDTFDKNVSRCNWECVVVNKSTDFVTEMKVRIGKYRILSLDLTVTKSADDRCLNQTAYSSSKLADAWMWSTVNPLTHERNGFDKPGNNCNGSSVTSFSKSVQGQIRGKVACTFNLSNDPATQQLDRLHSSINDLIGNVLMEEIKELTEIWQSGAMLCYKETEQNSAYVCFSFNNRTSTESVEWPVRALPVLVIFIWIILQYGFHISFVELPKYLVINGMDSAFYSYEMMVASGVPDRMKITTAFLVAVIPILIEIVVLKKGDKMEELEEQELDEKIRSIVDEYYNNPIDGNCSNQNSLREEREREELTAASPTIIHRTENDGDRYI
ncbi:hypothetical protein ACROYT_G029190 [Oculina patagonica]